MKKEAYPGRAEKRKAWRMLGFNLGGEEAKDSVKRSLKKEVDLLIDVIGTDWKVDQKQKISLRAYNIMALVEEIALTWGEEK